MQYRVMVVYTEGGYTTIDAVNSAQAKQKVERLLEDDGIKSLSNFDVTHREWQITPEIETTQEVERPLSSRWKIKARNFAGRDKGNIRTFSVVGITKIQAIADLRKRFPLAGDTVEIRNLYRSTWEPYVTHRKPRLPARFLYTQDRSF